MKAVKVQYTVQTKFIEQNKKNIQAVMEAIKANPIEGMYYSTFQLEDKNTFIHINFTKDEASMQKLGDIAEFNYFRKSLKESSLINPPQQANITFIGSSWEI